MLLTSKIQGRKACDDPTKFQELVWDNIPTIQSKTPDKTDSVCTIYFFSISSGIFLRKQIIKFAFLDNSQYLPGHLAKFHLCEFCPFQKVSIISKVKELAWNRADSGDRFFIVFLYVHVYLSGSSFSSLHCPLHVAGPVYGRLSSSIMDSASWLSQGSKTLICLKNIS